jgi:hypothetical protein
VAIPRFIDISTDARIAKIDEMYGTVKSAEKLTRMVLVMNGNNTNFTQLITKDGKQYDFFFGHIHVANSTADGEVGDDGITSFLTNVTGFDVIRETDNGAGQNLWVEYQLQGASDKSNCAVRYTQASQTAAASVLKKTTGC